MLAGILPAPKHKYETYREQSNDKISSEEASRSGKNIPVYPNRKGFIPIDTGDFADGGAYPELHVVQYPLNMGKPGVKSTAVIPVHVDDKGVIQADAIVRQGSNRDKLVQTSMNDIKEKAKDMDKMALPEENEEIETAERTRLALESLIDSKIKSGKGSTVVQSNEVADANYIRYTPNPTAPGYNAGAKQRVIKMVEAQVDPMEPPKFKTTKVPRGPPSPPVPVLHSPPRKITVEDQQAWKIPPCISNWKNARGFVIPLDKRLAADGRGLQEVTINNKFAMLSEALYISERKASEDIRIRNDIRKKMTLKEKEEREQQLRIMANKARLERAGVAAPEEEGISAGGMRQYREKDRGDEGEEEEEEEIEGFINESEEDKIARQQRERVRMEKRKEREREIRLDNMKGNLRKNKTDRDEGRDISEKIALGMLTGSAKMTGESLYDSRLFNQSSGMDSGFGAEDEYSTYTKPLFDKAEAGSIYRPKGDDNEMYGNAETQMKELSDTSRFKADKGFKGAEGGSGAGPRDAPVQFEKADPFGIDDIVQGKSSSSYSTSSSADNRSTKRRRYDDDD